MQRPILTFACCAFVLIALSSCNPPSLSPMPVGVQTITGTLLRTDIGLLKRGTHVLSKEGVRLALVESATVNLSAFESRDVGLTGVFERNADPGQPPVLVVSAVTPVAQDLQDLPLSALGISLRAPRDWKLTTEKGVASFTLAGTTAPLLTLAFDPTMTALPKGSPLLVQGRHAVRTTNEDTGAETAVIDSDGKFLVLHFIIPSAAEQNETLRSQWLSLLTSITILAERSSASVITGSGSGIPCGGTAGILCPGGEYCAITDFKENIGRCKAMR